MAVRGLELGRDVVGEEPAELLRKRALLLQLVRERADAVHGAVLSLGAAGARLVVGHLLHAELEDGHEARLGALLAQVDDEVARRDPLRLEVLHDVVRLAHELGRVLRPELGVAVVEAHHGEQDLAHERHHVGPEVLPRLRQRHRNDNVVDRLDHEALEHVHALRLGGEELHEQREEARREVVVEHARDGDLALLALPPVRLLCAHFGVAVLGEDSLHYLGAPALAFPEDAGSVVG